MRHPQIIDEHRPRVARVNHLQRRGEAGLAQHRGRSDEAPLDLGAERGWIWSRLREFLVLGIMLGIGAILLYFPYFVGFASQAGGLIPNLMYPTRGAQLWVMFATLWIPIFSYLIYRYIRQGTNKWYFILPIIVLAITLFGYFILVINNTYYFLIYFLC